MTGRRDVYSFIMAILTLAVMGTMVRLAQDDMAAELCRAVGGQQECSGEAAR